MTDHVVEKPLGRDSLLYIAVLLAGVVVGIVIGAALFPNGGGAQTTVYVTVGAGSGTGTTGTVAGTGGGTGGSPSQPAMDASKWQGIGSYLPPEKAASLLAVPAASPETTTVATGLPIVTLEAQLAKLEERPSSYGTTNVQVEGIDEPDIVENNGTHIFVAHGGVVEVYLAWPPSSLSLASSFDASRLVEELVGREQLVLKTGSSMKVLLNVTRSIRVAGLMASRGGLVVLAVDYPRPSLPGLEPRTWVILLGRDLKPRWARAVSGVVWDARLDNNTVIVVTSQWRFSPPIILAGRSTLIGPAVVVGNIPASTTIAAFDLATGNYSVVSLVGAAPRALYVAHGGRVYLALPGAREGKEIVGKLPLPVVSWSRTKLVALRASPGGIEPLASTELPGVIRKQWQMDLYNDTLRVVMTAYTGNGTRVDLYILNATTLKPVSRLEGIAVRERIHAVRFIGPTLYLVTFRSIDPLFAIDISDPRHPKVLGYLEAPGFDEYIHPLDQHSLLGVGREDGRVRVTLYRLEGAVPKPVSRIYLGPEGSHSWSPVLSARRGHRAFTLDPRRGLLLLPFVTYRGHAKGGVAVIHVDIEEGRLSLETVLEHNGATRATYIDGAAYTIAPSSVPRIRAWNLTSGRLVAEAPSPVKATVEDIVENPGRYLGRLVEVEGVYAGWESAAGTPPPVTRSDWVLRGKTGAEIYVTGRLPAPPTEANKLIVRVVGVVEERNGTPYIRAYSVEVIGTLKS